jgi:hypothetical protein
MIRDMQGFSSNETVKKVVWTGVVVSVWGGVLVWLLEQCSCQYVGSVQCWCVVSVIDKTDIFQSV